MILQSFAYLCVVSLSYASAPKKDDTRAEVEKAIELLQREAGLTEVLPP